MLLFSGFLEYSVENLFNRFEKNLKENFMDRTAKIEMFAREIAPSISAVNLDEPLTIQMEKIQHFYVTPKEADTSSLADKLEAFAKDIDMPVRYISREGASKNNPARVIVCVKYADNAPLRHLEKALTL
jgi:hypothetical protein